MKNHFYAVNAKIHALRGQMLTYADYEDLSGLGSVERIASRLREIPGYAQVLSGLEGIEVHRGMLEQKLNLSLHYDYARLRLYFSDKRLRDYLSALFMQYELNFIKQLLCMVFDERKISFSLPELDVMLGREFSVNAAKLASSETVPEFIEQLRGTGLYRMLADTYARKQSLFEIERQLDLYYYLQLWKKQEQLDTRNRAIMTRIKGAEIDMRNIMWLYRLRHYYRINDARVYAYLIPINHRLTAQAVNRMVGSSNMAEFTHEASMGPYGGIFHHFDQPEPAFIKAMRKIYRREIREHPDSLAAVAGYIFDREQEINNITAVLECVRYGLTAPETLKYVCVQEKVSSS